MSLVQLLSTTGTEEDKKIQEEVNELHEKLRNRDSEVIELQKKVIELYEQLHKK